MKEVAENVWTLRYPLPVLGSQFGRTVTIIRLAFGKLVIHSTGKFSGEDVAAIRGLGEPGWLVDASRFHDTYAKDGRARFPEIPYLVPPAFDKEGRLKSQPLMPPPQEWEGELEVMPLAGMPLVQEHVFYHPPSRSLIVCDLIFHFGQRRSRWRRLISRYLMGLHNGIGMSFFFRLSVRDKTAFLGSLKRILQWDFQRIIVGHGDVLEGAGRELLIEALRRRGLGISW